MVNLNDFSLGLSIAGFLACLSNLIFSITGKHLKKPQNKLYLLMLVLLAISAGCGTAAYLSEPHKLYSDTAFHVLTISRYVYFLAHSLLPPLFFWYISFVVGRSINWNPRSMQHQSEKKFLFHNFSVLAVAAMELLIICNPLLHWTWTFDESRDFQRENGEMLIYIQAAFWLTAAIILLTHSWNILSPNRKHALAVCYALVLFGILIQLFFPEIYIEVLM